MKKFFFNFFCLKINYAESDPLSVAIASISSKKIMLGEEILAFLEFK